MITDQIEGKKGYAGEVVIPGDLGDQISVLEHRKCPHLHRKCPQLALHKKELELRSPAEPGSSEGYSSCKR